MRLLIMNPLSTVRQGAEFNANVSIFAVFCYILLFIGILALAYFSTRFVGSAYDRSRGESKIRVIDRKMLSQDKSIVVVKVADIHYVLYSDRSHTQLLDKLDSYPIDVQPEKPVNFQSILHRILNQKKDSNA